MELVAHPADIRWWFWATTLGFMLAAIAGWSPGYYAVIAISGLQVLYFLAQERSPSAFPTQIRIVYFALTLFGFVPAARTAVYVLLAIGTVMVTLFGRCAIALVLSRMPWNHGRAVRLN